MLIIAGPDRVGAPVAEAAEARHVPDLAIAGVVVVRVELACVEEPASITQTIFDGGRRRATSDAARASYDATVAAYRQTTLTAFQQVEDNLAALRILEQEAQQQRRAVESAQQSLQLFTNRYRGGVDNYLQVITAQTVTLTNQRNEIDILRRRMDASVLLVKALGGGWDVAALPKA